MILADLCGALMFLVLTLYALFGGADFGAGIWDLLAGSAEKGYPVRQRIAATLGPIWEANHVWLIFLLVIFWTCFPAAYVAVVSTLWIPFGIAAIGIICRGSAFAFRKEASALWLKRLFGFAFAASSLVTPFAFGTIAGAVASGRVPEGIAAGNVVTSWLSPLGVFAGLLAACTCAYLAACYLCADAKRAGEEDNVRRFRKSALGAAIAVGALCLVGIAVLRMDAGHLFHGLLSRALPLVLVSAAAGLTSIVLLVTRHFRSVRIAAAVAIVSVLWAWPVAQYPDMLGNRLTLEQAAAPALSLILILVLSGAGLLIVVPSLAFLFGLFQRPRRAPREASGTSPGSPPEAI